MSTDTAALRALALAAAQNAYAPYSGFRVGAALRSQGGQVHVGCNVENAAFPIGGCAERAAIAAAVLVEGARLRIGSIAIVACDADGRLLPSAPCGACRQAIAEFAGAGDDTVVAFGDADGQWCEVSAAALLPYRFVLPQAR